MPRLDRGIQYAAAYRLTHCRLWDAGSPAFAGDDRLCVWQRPNDAGEETYVSIFTYSKSPGRLSMPTLGGAIHDANSPTSVTGCISEAM